MGTIYEARRAMLKSYLSENNITAVMITAPANVFYFTGFNSDPHERFMSLFIDMHTNNTYLFVPALDKDAALLVSDITTIIPISDEQIPFEVVRESVGEISKTVGIEAKALSYYLYNSLLEFFPGVQVVDVQPFINKQRMKKSKEEIAKLITAIEIIEKVLEEGIKKVKIGMSESDLTGELEFLMRKFGADGPSFSTIVLTGEKAALPHGSPGERKLQKGDYLLIDFGVIKDGYCSDITRTFIIGEASEQQKEIYDIVLRSNEAGINAVQAGVPLKTFDIEARNVIIANGYGEYFNNRVGHGLGIELHEEPSIHQNNEQIAEAGLVFTIEPGIYIPEVGGVRIEDTVYINEDGKVEVLSSFPKQLQIL
ncbi:aminopeptidase P family protein [Sporosarcina sp. ANT_H38]|uniref:M24 family metallopeptidase n=1 Tax=Sporosarcina sp. ANT_H38 TaxID=2597358 RepID=UPI0011F3EDE4|nr:Xaa-Pro peptidase family protein [Sporosarcina sp. ANT_H38]KAA0948733.1 aminopeptidase P family protein [Sporosarcina sp. ANT_H38]